MKMKKEKNAMSTKKKSSWATALSIGFTAFAAHAGGGFATGNQANKIGRAHV